MSRVFITGDMHGIIGVARFKPDNFIEGMQLSKDDYVIVCGDFGLIFATKSIEEENDWLNWLNDRPWTTLFIDGNHENFNRLNSYEVEEWHGGKVHRIRPSIIHLMRGQVFDIAGHTWFTYGGAESIDRMYRVPYQTWWPQETPSLEEYNEGVRNLREHSYKVDFIITHAAPQNIIEELFYNNRTKPNGTPYQLYDFYRMCEFGEWYCGHYHLICDVQKNFHMLYHKIIEIKMEDYFVEKIDLGD